MIKSESFLNLFDRNQLQEKVHNLFSFFGGGGAGGTFFAGCPKGLHVISFPFDQTMVIYLYL